MTIAMLAILGKKKGILLVSEVSLTSGRVDLKLVLYRFAKRGIALGES
jgi:hypothetical protein